MNILNIYITEESELLSEKMSCITPRLSNGGKLSCHVKEVSHFSNEKTFKDRIQSIMSKMSASNSDYANLLIISAHGDEVGNIELNKWDYPCSRYLDLRSCSNEFGQFPSHCVVYLNMCKGLFPRPSQALRFNQNIKPIIIAPVVNIDIDHANNFQHKLINVLKKSSDNEDAIFHQIELFNSKIKHKYKQCNGKDFNFAMGIFKRAETKPYPDWGVMQHD